MTAVISCGGPVVRPAHSPTAHVQAVRSMLRQAVPAVKGGLRGVSADSGTDAWAIGEFAIVHWNGKRWSAVADSVPGTRGGLEAVLAFSKDDVWIAGSGKSSGFLLHWNGRTWTKVSAPALAGIEELSGLAGASPANVWAVGSTVPGVALPVIVHWNGKSWSRVKAPLPHGVKSGYLNGVATASATSAWAVGGYTTAHVMHSLALHWNGEKWIPVASPSPGSDAYLQSVSASPAGIWAAGYGGTSGQFALVLHWNGKAWTKAAIPNPEEVDVKSVTALSPTSAWAIGEYSDSVFVNPDKPLIMHWNGKAWSRVANPAPQDTVLWSMAALSGTSAWVVGAHTNGAPIPGGANARAVILRLNGATWS